MIRKPNFIGIIAILGTAIFITDSKTALEGAQTGVSICIRTVIPTLFPLFVLSSLITGNLAGKGVAILRPMGKLCGLSSGSEHIFLLGVLGGYPTGAISVSEAHNCGKITVRQAKHMLMFCSNAGPAFIFGVCGPTFSNKLCTWFLWLVQIISSVFVGWLFKSKNHNDSSPAVVETKTTFAQAMDRGIINTFRVCGWVIIFRAFMTVVQNRMPFSIPNEMNVLFLGVVELTNGCVVLNSVVAPGMRFIIASGLLTFGGICVTMQTSSVIGELDLLTYILGKLIQTICSVFLATVIQYVIFASNGVASCSNMIMLISGAILFIIAVCMHLRKIRVDFPRKMVYNQENRYKERKNLCSFGRR